MCIRDSNGEPYDGYILPGTYASIERTWNDNDKIEVELDMRARVVDAPSGVGDAAIVRGPIVLAFDSRLIPRRDGVTEPPMYRYEFMRDTDNYCHLYTSTRSSHTRRTAISTTTITMTAILSLIHI